MIPVLISMVKCGWLGWRQPKWKIELRNAGGITQNTVNETEQCRWISNDKNSKAAWVKHLDARGSSKGLEITGVQQMWAVTKVILKQSVHIYTPLWRGYGQGGGKGLNLWVLYMCWDDRFYQTLSAWILGTQRSLGQQDWSDIFIIFYKDPMTCFHPPLIPIRSQLEKSVGWRCTSPKPQRPPTRFGSLSGGERVGGDEEKGA